MAVKIRLKRRGRKKLSLFDVVVADSRAPRDGKFIEKIGSYNPNTDPATIELNEDKAFDWVMKGAQPTDTVRAMLSYRGILLKKHLQIGVLKGAITQEEADKKFDAWVKQKEQAIEKKRTGLAEAEDKKRKERLAAEKKVNEARIEALRKKKEEAAEALKEEISEGSDETEEVEEGAEAPATAEQETVEETVEAPAEAEETEAPAEEAEVKEETPAEEKEEAPAEEAKTEEPTEEAPVEEKSEAAEESKEEASEEEKKD